MRFRFPAAGFDGLVRLAVFAFTGLAVFAFTGLAVFYSSVTCAMA
jgi:predicted exporter